MNTKFLNDEYLMPLLSKVDQEEKIFLLMGNFNFNLLSSNTKPKVSEFMDNFPYISILYAFLRLAKFFRLSEAIFFKYYFRVQFLLWQSSVSNIGSSSPIRNNFPRKTPQNQKGSFQHN